MPVTSGLSSITAQALTTAYQTVFEAKAPQGAGSDGPPVRGIRFICAGDTGTIKLSTVSGIVTEHPIAVGQTSEYFDVPGGSSGGFKKAEAKGASTSTTLIWEKILM